MGELRFKKELITFIITASIVILLIMTTIPPAAAVYLDAGTPSSTSVTQGNTITFSNVNLTIRGAERIPVNYLNFSIFRNSDDQRIAYVKFHINGSEIDEYPSDRFSVEPVNPLNFSAYWGSCTYGYDENTGWNENFSGYGYGYGNNTYMGLTILYNISYTTHTAGTFYARLSVNSSIHTYWSNRSQTFTVSSPPSPPSGGGVTNHPPVADAGGPYEGYVNEAIHFDGSSSSDSDNDELTYTWDFGDGSTGSGISPTHVYTSAGTYTVTLTVEDSSGATGSDTTTATIFNESTTNLPPIADTGGPYHGLTSGDILFDASNSYDPDGSIVNYTWSFGDGTYGYGMKVSHRYNEAKIYNVTLTVRDNNGLTDTATTTADIALDTDGDGWSDLEEETYGTNPNNTDDSPVDTDGDRIPDDYDDNDDNDGLNDRLEEILGSDPKDSSDVESIENEWFIVDTNKDGKYDEFYDSNSGITTTIKHGSNGEILLDTDGDGQIDHVYNPASGEIETYKVTGREQGIPIIFIILGVIGVIILIIVILFKTGYLYIEDDEWRYKK